MMSEQSGSWLDNSYMVRCQTEMSCSVNVLCLTIYNNRNLEIVGRAQYNGLHG